MVDTPPQQVALLLLLQTILFWLTSLDIAFSNTTLYKIWNESIIQPYYNWYQYRYCFERYIIVAALEMMQDSSGKTQLLSPVGALTLSLCIWCFCCSCFMCLPDVLHVNVNVILRLLAKFYSRHFPPNASAVGLEVCFSTSLTGSVRCSFVLMPKWVFVIRLRFIHWHQWKWFTDFLCSLQILFFILNVFFQAF